MANHNVSGEPDQFEPVIQVAVGEEEDDGQSRSEGRSSRMAEEESEHGIDGPRQNP